MRCQQFNAQILQIFTFEVGQGDGGTYGPHYHTIDLTTSDIRELKAGKIITVLTSSSIGHTHEIDLIFRGAERDARFGYCKYQCNFA